MGDKESDDEVGSQRICPNRPNRNGEEDAPDIDENENDHNTSEKSHTEDFSCNNESSYRSQEHMKPADYTDCNSPNDELDLNQNGDCYTNLQ